ncbi:ac53 [Lambdina fiscellaria nucleopolyhedrovirus]|uniref:Ac53 n=1 Tax=Lambdina fiscellaria nucleopolyhedrovirus TaxID=1642929 RepID=A0A0E3Z7G7_9ABAC|nr:ac53 [Lambdina fiscellaria nucleopolyhedrovirus]AKC91727.1 ac53 [Lambdina fiscellaria nucleopolyhedrovirus]
MLITVNVHDKKSYLFQTFKRLWKQHRVECKICLDVIVNDGVIVVTEHATLNLDKMFHGSCLNKWYATGGRFRDPFNRAVKYKFNFPPKTLDECGVMLDQITGFIGDEAPDKAFALQYKKVHEQQLMDVDLDFEKMLTYK